MGVEDIYFEELSKELAAQREARESLRTRAIALLSAGAVVFALTRSQSSGHLDAWLLASLLVLVVMGFCVALVVAPAPITTMERSLNFEDMAEIAEEQSDNDADRRLFRSLIFRAREGISSNREWTNRRSLLYLTATVLLVVEIALIAAHFSNKLSYRLAVAGATALFLAAFAIWPLRSVVEVIHAQQDTVFPQKLWDLAERIPMLGRFIERRRFADSALMAPLESLRVPAPIPGEVPDYPPHAEEVEDAIRTDGDLLGAFRQASIYALGRPAGVVSGISGTESDLLHFTADVADKEETFLPVFTHARFMIQPLMRNPDWRSLSVLEIKGDALLDNVDDDVTVVINPWSDLEFQIPPAAHVSDRPLQQESGLVTTRHRSDGKAKPAVLRALVEKKGLTAAEIAAATGLKRGTVNSALARLAKSGEVVKANRGYRLPTGDSAMSDEANRHPTPS